MRVHQGDNVCEFDRGLRVRWPTIEQVAFSELLDLTDYVFVDGVRGIVANVEMEGSAIGVIQLVITWESARPAPMNVPWA